MREVWSLCSFRPGAVCVIAKGDGRFGPSKIWIQIQMSDADRPTT